MALTFNATYYFTQRPDVLNAYFASGTSVSAQEFALNHYNNFGWKEGSNPNEVFDTSDYLSENPDVAAAGINPFQHYQQFGQAEGRAPNATFPSLAEFDAEAYLSANPDLGAAGINTAAEAYDHYITFGYAEGRPGAPDNADFQLVATLENVTAAEGAIADFLDTLDLDNNPATDTTASDVVTALSTAESTLAADISANGSTRSLNETLATQKAQLAAAVTAFNATATPAEEAALTRYLQLGTEIVAATEAVTNAQTGADAQIAAFVAARAEEGEVVAFDGATDTLVNVGADGAIGGGDDIVLARAEFVNGVDNSDGVRFVSTVAGSSVEGVAGVVSALNSVEVAADARAELVDERAAIDTALAADLEVGVLYGTVATEDADVAAAQAALDLRQDNVDAVAEAEVNYNQLVALEGNLTAAQNAVLNLGFDNFALNAGNANGLGVDLETDLFVYSENNTADNTSITNFDAEDTLYFGSNYTASKVSATANLNGNADFGSVSALDIFLQQVGADTVIYVENDTFDGQANGTWAGETIRLVGVDVDDISVDSNGILRINEAAVA